MNALHTNIPGTGILRSSNALKAMPSATTYRTGTDYFAGILQADLS